MSLRITALIYMACFAALSIGLYLVKYSVQDVQRNVTALKQQVAAEKESLHLLNAEWAYLNRPERLQRLSQKHLELVSLQSKQIEEIHVLPAAVTVSPETSPSALYQPATQVTEAR